MFAKKLLYRLVFGNESNLHCASSRPVTFFEFLAAAAVTRIVTPELGLFATIRQLRFVMMVVIVLAIRTMDVLVVGVRRLRGQLGS
jgi:hypothetical protein